MGKLDQLKKMQNQQKNSSLSILQAESSENLFDDEPVEKKEEITEENVENKVKEIENGIKQITEENVEKEIHKDSPVQEKNNKKESNEIYYISDTKKYATQKAKEGTYKRVTVRVPETLYNDINEVCTEFNISMSMFAKASVENCLEVDYEDLIWYDGSFSNCIAKNDRFSIRGKVKYKSAVDTKSITCTMKAEEYNRSIQLASEHEEVESLNDLFVLFLNTQFIKIKE